MPKFSKDGAKKIGGLVIASIGLAVILFYALVLAGCTSGSPGMSNLFLVKLHKAGGKLLTGTAGNATAGNGTLTDLAANVTIRIGYFGMCTSIGSGSLNCSGTYSHDGTQISTSFLPQNDFSTVTLFNLASHIQSKVFVFMLAVSAVIFLSSFVVLIALQFDIMRNSSSSAAYKRRFFLKKGFKNLVWISVGLNIAVSAGAQQAAEALQWLSDVRNGELLITSGATLLGLQWAIVAFSMIFALGSRLIYNQKPAQTIEQNFETKDGVMAF
ncbi:hypothetical protein HYALB_00005791 [Hymenoscyphus albidus]|uniref:Uncharacterized protein n=1 Tax=Hymenoscyphus albidus TaxID=595503 RepID=A0A9N9PW22_9HELO|nr:hypothetical protein HYALB_00005791 [Hymenoscyphus albidus]